MQPSSVDPFLAANPRYRAAIRFPHKTGSAFEVMPGRRLNTGLIAAAAVNLLFWVVLIGAVREVIR